MLDRVHPAPYLPPLVKAVHSVLVTGGTGTFGGAFIPYLLSQPDIARVCVYSRGEHAQAGLRQALGGDSRLRWFIGDIRDLPRLTRAMRGVDTVVHAAALKRIETGAYCPDEMVKTNILGTMNVIEAAATTGVARVIGLSSDKAYQPISPYGQSKALAESLLLSANGMYGAEGPRYAVARYGNIWGAQGSIVPLWRVLQASGALRVPVTSLDCTRFYMTVGEAVRLIWDLAVKMQGGELVIPDWLPAYRIGDLVMAFGLEPQVNGLPAWEKLHESMNETLCSRDAYQLTVKELREALAHEKT